MKIPKSVRIGGVEYEVIDNVSGLNDGQNVLAGEINYNDFVIRLNEVVAGHQMKCIKECSIIGSRRRSSQLKKERKRK